jgi:hypothetical protein
MADAAQQVEQVPSAVGHGRAGQKKDQGRSDGSGLGVPLHAEELQAVASPLAGILDEVGLVQDHPGPADVVEPRGMLGEEIVVDDHPAGVFCRRYRAADNFYGGIRVDEEDFPAPVELERSGAHDEDFALGRPHLHRDDGLAGLSQIHVVTQHGAFLGQEEGNPTRMVRV